MIRVVRGNPSDEEVAALVVALRATSAPPPEPPQPESGWVRREELLRKPLHPGRDAWRRYRS